MLEELWHATAASPGQVCQQLLQHGCEWNSTSERCAMGEDCIRPSDNRAKQYEQFTGKMANDYRRSALTQHHYNLRARSTREDESWPVEHSQWLSGQTLDSEWASEHIPVAHATVKPARRQSFIFHIPIHNKNFPNSNKVTLDSDWASKEPNYYFDYLAPGNTLHLSHSLCKQGPLTDFLPQLAAE